MIELKPFEEADLGAMAALLEDPAVLRFTRVPVPPPDDFPRIWFDAYEVGRRDGTRELFTVAATADGEFLGLAMAPRIDRAARTAELGYVVAPHARGRGVATQALAALTAWAFEAQNVFRSELLISVDNEASKRVAARCGYVREGVLRAMHFKADLREDTELWSRLITDA
jgi:RimJ/RimL family protein N-acetyltransferase